MVHEYEIAEMTAVPGCIQIKSNAGDLICVIIPRVVYCSNVGVDTGAGSSRNVITAIASPGTSHIASASSLSNDP